MINIYDNVVEDHVAQLIDAEMRNCLLYTTDDADELLCVDLVTRRIYKTKKTNQHSR